MKYLLVLPIIGHSSSNETKQTETQDQNIE
jgi:hypothetical protein